jgi:hypothetical protein
MLLGEDSGKVEGTFEGTPSLGGGLRAFENIID